jgi:nucleotide-binding universal stress UspA family protein
MKTDKMKKVLIALDYNLTAQKVAEKGFSLARAMGAETILLHVIADETYYTIIQYSQRIGFMGFSASEASHLFDDGLENAMKHFLDRSKLYLGDKSIQTIVKEGDFAESILKTAKDTHADVIVMGSHSRKWLEDIVMGSVTEKVLLHTSLPMFIIPTKEKH